jgi:hypothetical protein
MWTTDIRVKGWQLLAILVFGAVVGGIGAAFGVFWMVALAVDWEDECGDETIEAEELGLEREAIRYRLLSGLSIGDALRKPDSDPTR